MTSADYTNQAEKALHLPSHPADSFHWVAEPQWQTEGCKEPKGSLKYFFTLHHLAMSGQKEIQIFNVCTNKCLCSPGFKDALLLATRVKLGKRFKRG